MIASFCLTLALSTAADPWTLLQTAPLAAALEATPELARQADTSYLVQRWDRAIEQYGRLVAGNPTVGLYWYRLGLCYLQAGQYAEALEPLAKSHELGAFQWNPPRMVHRGEAAWGLAAAHARLGHRDEALHWTRVALAAGLRDIRRFHERHFETLLKDPEFRGLVWAVDTEGLSRGDGYRLDIRFLLHEAKRIHYAPFRQTSEQQLNTLAQELIAEVDSLSDDQVLVRMMKLVRHLGDGHTKILREDRPRRLPVALFVFPEGLYITAAQPPYTELVGAKVLRIGNRSAQEALAAAGEIASRDNPMTVVSFAPMLLVWPHLLRGLGIASNGGPVPLEIEDAEGNQRRVELSEVDKPAPPAEWSRQVPGCDRPLPLSARARAKTYFWELLPEQRALYCQLNGVGTDEGRTLADFCRELFEVAARPEVDALIVDLRYNPGGNTFMNPPLIEGIIRSDKLNRPGGTFVIIGRTTFSAAQNTTSDLERRTKAILVGEPTGSSPNFIGESLAIPLPYSKLVLSVSDLWWQHSMAMDYRIWTPPQLYAPPTAAALRAHRDVALEAIAAYREQAGKKK